MEEGEEKVENIQTSLPVADRRSACFRPNDEPVEATTRYSHTPTILDSHLRSRSDQLAAPLLWAIDATARGLLFSLFLLRHCTKERPYYTQVSESSNGIPRCPATMTNPNFLSSIISPEQRISWLAPPTIHPTPPPTATWIRTRPKCCPGLDAA